jgi:hypothetical protein
MHIDMIRHRSLTAIIVISHSYLQVAVAAKNEADIKAKGYEAVMENQKKVVLNLHKK